jgi:ribulose-phosphate 3-epimerase
MFEIIPGILEKDWLEIEKKLEIVKSFTKNRAGSAQTVHIDFIDGKFASNITFLDPIPFSKYAPDLFLEAHLMVDNPIQFLEPLVKAGFKRFIGQIEKMPDQTEFVAKAERLGEVGLAIDGPTNLSDLKVSYGDLDCILIMMIKAGQSGQEFNPEYLKKVDAIRKLEKLLPIEIDGGVNDKTISVAKSTGVNRFVSTSFIFGAQNPQEQYNLLKNK